MKALTFCFYFFVSCTFFNSLQVVLFFCGIQHIHYTYLCRFLLYIFSSQLAARPPRHDHLYGRGPHIQCHTVFLVNFCPQNHWLIFVYSLPTSIVAIKQSYLRNRQHKTQPSWLISLLYYTINIACFTGRYRSYTFEELPCASAGAYLREYIVGIISFWCFEVQQFGSTLGLHEVQSRDYTYC